MELYQQQKPQSSALLDTLAQLGTSPSGDPDFALISQSSTGDKTNLQKRARSKYFSTAVALRLVDLDSPLVKQYWNTFHCAEQVEVRGQKVTSHYCKNRWCLVCNRIRTADLIKRYSSTLFEWSERHFVTLTVPNVKAQFLPQTIKILNDEFRKIQETMKKRGQRGSGPRLVAVRKLECTYNPQRDDYHPHFHVVTQDRAMADTLLQEWLSRHPECSNLAQDVRPASRNDLIELFKYFTKILSKSKGADSYGLNPESLDIIFRAIKGSRTFQPVGFKLPVCQTDDVQNDSDNVQDDFATQADQSVYFDWIQEFHDWISSDGELLSEYEPTSKLEKLVNHIS